jgi:HEAT repeat protein
MFKNLSFREGYLLVKIGIATVVALVGLVFVWQLERDEKQRQQPRGDPVKEREEILAGMKSDDPAQRGPACTRLGKYRPLTTENVEMLVAALGDKDATVRASATAAVAELGPMFQGKPEWAKVVAPAATKALDDPDGPVVLSAIRILGHCGESGQMAVEPLKKQLTSDDPTRRLAAASALHKLDPMAAGAAVPVLIDFIKDRKIPSEVRKQAIDLLGTIGEPAREAAEPLLKIATGKSDRGVRIAAAGAAVRVDPEAAPKAAEALVALIKDIDVETKGVLKKPAIRTGPNGQIILNNPDALGNKLGIVRADAIRVLKQLDAQAAEEVNQ